MGSTFSGLEIARSAIMATQVALNVTGQNVANVNTEDYTRQSANLVSVNYTTGVTKFASLTSATVGQGVSVSGINQIRDALLDKSVRNANSQYSTKDVILSALNDIENVLDETTTDGLHAMLGDFYESLQNLSNNVGDTEYASLVRSAAEKVTQVLNQYATQLSSIRDEQETSLGLAVDQVNTTIDKINAINAQIKDQTIRGTVSNELLDLRNSYLDTLSGYLNINVSANNDGTVSVASGAVDLLDSTFSLTVSGDQLVLQVDSGGTTTDFTPDEGQIRGYLDILNGAGSYAEAGENGFQGLLYYERALDAFAEAFAGTFNDLNTLDVSSPANLFTGTTAATITISDDWDDNPNYLVVADQGTNDNIVKMLNAMNKDVDTSLYPGLTGTFEGFSTMLMSEIAVDVSYYSDMSGMYENILKSAINARESVIGVSIDEETVNMTKYQRAYQAAARLMSVMDENLDTLINRTGVVGR